MSDVAAKRERMRRLLDQQEADRRAVLLEAYFQLRLALLWYSVEVRLCTRDVHARIGWLVAEFRVEGQERFVHVPVEYQDADPVVIARVAVQAIAARAVAQTRDVRIRPEATVERAPAPLRRPTEGSSR